MESGMLKKKVAQSKNKKKQEKNTSTDGKIWQQI